MSSTAFASARDRGEHLLARTRRVYRSGGLMEIAKRASFQIFKYDPQYLYLLRGDDRGAVLDESVGALVERVRPLFEIAWLTDGAAETLPSYLDYRRDLEARQVRAWLDAGHLCAIVSHRARIVGDGWLAVQSFPIPDSSLVRRLESGAYAFTFLSSVIPAYRSRGVMPLLIDEQLGAMRRRGKRHLLGTVYPTNTPSIRSVEKMGFAKVGTLHACWLFGRKLAKARYLRPLPD